VTPFGSFTVYWQREVWKLAAGNFYFIEEFERDPTNIGMLGMPYMSGTGFLFYGNGNPEIITSPQSLTSGNMLHIRDGEQGFTLSIPRNQAVKAFGFDYAAPQEWIIAFSSLNLPLPAVNNGFVGFIFHQDFPVEFQFSSPVGDPSGFGLSLDNVSFVSFFMPVTPTMTPVPEPTPLTP
jgi:hypothetical protein